MIWTAQDIKNKSGYYKSSNAGKASELNWLQKSPEWMTVLNPKWTQRAIDIISANKQEKETPPGPVSFNSENSTPLSRLSGRRLSFNQNSPIYSKAQYVYNKLMSYPGMNSDVAMLLTLLAGAESGYNPKASSSFASGGGLGGWIGSNRGTVLDYVNKKYGKKYSKIDDIPLDEQIDALKWFYYDKNKSFVDSRLDDVAILSKYGFSPAITKTGSWTSKKPAKSMIIRNRVGRII